MLTYTEILKALSNCIFDELNEDNFYSNIISLMDTNILKKSWNNGATKLVLTPPEEDFVIKIPFCGDSFSDSGELLFFEGAEEPDGWDYCLAELLIYNEALSFGVERFFLQTERIGYIHGHPIYVQKKANVFGETNHVYKDYSLEQRQKARKICDEVGFDSRPSTLGWTSDFLDCYSKKDLKSLNDFIKTFHINDLHCDNLGYLNGSPVIIDYASYHEW